MPSKRQQTTFHKNTGKLGYYYNIFLIENKTTMTESDTRINLIDPKLYSSGWENKFISREYYFTDGRKLISNKKGKKYFVDYLLTYKNTNLAIIEAKSEDKNPLDGLQQSINYAQKLKIDYVTQQMVTKFLNTHL